MITLGTILFTLLLGLSAYYWGKSNGYAEGYRHGLAFEHKYRAARTENRGRRKGHKHSEATKEKMRQSALARIEQKRVELNRAINEHV